MLPLIIDNTKLSAFRACPRKYYFRHILGLKEDKVAPPLNFNAAIHAGYAAWLLGSPQDTDIGNALRSMQAQAFDAEEWRTPDKVVELLTELFKEEPPPLIADKEGKPLVEVSFSFPLLTVNDSKIQELLKAAGYSDLIYCGIVDMFSSIGDKVIIVDHKGCGKLEGKKGEGKRLPSYFWSGFKPHCATTGYLWGASQFFKDRIHTVMINGLGCDRYGTSFGRQTFTYVPEEVEEWRQSTISTVNNLLHTEIEHNLSTRYNSDACFNFGRRCEYQQMCSLPASQRKGFEGNYKVEHWNPLEVRKEEAAKLGSE
jgi:hypothetical protein